MLVTVSDCIIAGHFITATGPVKRWYILKDCRVFMSCDPEAEFLDLIGTKVLRVFLLAIHSHLTRIPTGSSYLYLIALGNEGRV